MLLQNEAIVQETVTRWKAQGIKLAIDDFGTGYSSLAYLKHFRVDKLKIDRSFIIDILQDEEARAIVQAMIQMARGLNLRTIAVGVEEAAVAEQLRVMGCDEAQGYLYSPPLAAEEFIGGWLPLSYLLEGARTATGPGVGRSRPRRRPSPAARFPSPTVQPPFGARRPPAPPALGRGPPPVPAGGG